MDPTGASSRSQNPRGRRERLVLKPSQRETLQAAFEQNPYPGITTREELARETGIAENRIQTWFGNRRAGHLRKSRSASGQASEEEPSQGQGGPQPWSPENFPKAARRKRTRITTSQTSLLVEAVKKNRYPGLCRPSTRCHDGPARPDCEDSRDLSCPGDTPEPIAKRTHCGRQAVRPSGSFLVPITGNYQDRDQHAVSAGWLAQDPSRPDNSKTQGRAPTQQVTAPFTQWGCEVAQGVTVRWEPSQDTLQHPGHSEVHLWPEPAQSAQGSCRPPDQDCQETESLLDELLSTPELQGKSQTFLNADPQEEDPPQLGLSLVNIDFRALLNALQD
nr:double homeobox protein 4-like protein 4 [Loxodonta africana]